MLTEGVAQAIEKARQTGGIHTDELLTGLSLGIVASFDVVPPKNRKNMVEEVEGDDACECIPDFVSAISYLQARDLLHNEIRPCDFWGSLNPTHFEALDALNKLFTIAQAWNIRDGFVPDFSNRGQKKWFPWFTYEKATKRFVFSSTVYTPTSAFANIGSRLCFKTQGRAEQFGKQFADLYNKVFL